MTGKDGDRKGWWDTSIIRVRPNELMIKGYAIEDLMGRVTFGEMAYLMIKGELPSDPWATKLLDALLVAVCDHGANSPAIATSIMAATCGIPLNCVMASGMNLLGEIHGGPIEEAARVFYRTDRLIEESGRQPRDVVTQICTEYRTAGDFLPGFGHPVHRKDPRVTRLFEMLGQAKRAGAVTGRYMEWALLFEEVLPDVFSKKAIPLNVDGGGAVVLCEARIPSETAMGFVCLSRGLGLMAHAYETRVQKQRLKAPMPPELIGEHMTYSGPPPRRLPGSRYTKEQGE